MAAVRNGILARMQKATLLALAAALAAALPAAETNVVDAIALGRLGTGVSDDGWTAAGLDNYAASSDSALRFNAKDDRLVSPVFPRPVTRVVLRAMSSSAANRRLAFTSSSAANRRLAFTPLRGDGTAATNLTRRCAYSPSRYAFPEQTLAWPWSARVTAFRVQLEGGGSTGWGIKALSVVFDDPAPGTAVVVR